MVGDPFISLYHYVQYVRMTKELNDSLKNVNSVLDQYSWGQKYKP